MEEKLVSILSMIKGLGMQDMAYRKQNVRVDVIESQGYSETYEAEVFTVISVVGKLDKVTGSNLAITTNRNGDYNIFDLDKVLDVVLID